MAKLEIRDENFVMILGWMRTKLGLKGNELYAYALIYGFSQDGISEFKGPLPYIMDWVGCSEPTAISTLKKLVDKGLIIKREEITGNNQKKCFYRADLEALKNFKAPLKNLSGTPKKTLGDPLKNLSGPPKKILGNNNINNSNNNIYTSSKNRFHNFEQRNYDYDSLEMILRNKKSAPATSTSHDAPSNITI